MTRFVVDDSVRGGSRGRSYSVNIIEEDGSEDGILYAEAYGRTAEEAQERASLIVVLLNRAPTHEPPRNEPEPATEEQT